MEGEGGSVKKRYGEEEEIDSFSILPDSLIHEILSFLNVKEAAITSVLSKRWEFLWADSPNLELSDDDGGEEREFVSWVNRTLSLRKVNYLNKFHVTFDYCESFSSDVDAWVKFAAENNVKQLNLHLHCDDDLYQPPEAMYRCPSLTKLSLMGCTLSMDSKASIEWQSLTNLYLSMVYVDEHLLGQIFSTCPVLSTLVLGACQGFDRLDVNNSSVHSLKIQDCEYDEEVAPPLKISAPYIHNFDIVLPEEGRKMQLVGEFSSLVRVDIDFDEFPWVSSNVDLMHDAEQLLQRLKDVKELYVGLQFIKAVSMTGFTLPQSTRELLVVASDIECHKSSIYGIIRLLESSPNLETLVIKGIKGFAPEEDFAIQDSAAVGRDLTCNLSRLKTISIQNFSDPNGEPMLTLARILLRRATGLENMDVMVDVAENSDFNRIDKELRLCPRASIKAQFTIKRHAVVSR